MHQNLANATFQVIAGGSSGSGFSFMRPDIVVTNFHVVSSLIDVEKHKTLGFITLLTESGQQLQAEIKYADLANDFAILQLLEALPENRVVLQPAHGFLPERGARLIFAGYPHGFAELLTSEAIISAPMTAGRFAIDGMVNSGNSGGPIIDSESGNVVGIITQRRYASGEKAQQLYADAAQLRAYLRHASQNMSVAIMGVDFGRMADMFGRSLQVITELLDLNANPGIGIGFPILPVSDWVKQNQTLSTEG
ncbi:serine protease [Leclercia adecarboxylata]|uniref:S1 family peptidase n=1 Tax=Leclercia adecarboxylata TaxID=83655 RepID=UPI0022B7B9F8|nr:serine protease [Leclercia adecarboxylata]MCZ7840127.1 serine protease [Leclercia adecarboxylata]